MSTTNYNYSLANQAQFEAEYRIVYEALHNEPQTMKQVSIANGIDRANICRYIGVLKSLGKIQVYKIGVCPKSRYSGVKFWTTDPTKFREDPQLNLFY